MCVPKLEEQYFEQPMPLGLIADAARLRQQTTTPIALKVLLVGDAFLPSWNILATKHVIQRGSMAVPEEPGLGVQVDEKKVEKHRV